MTTKYQFYYQQRKDIIMIKLEGKGPVKEMAVDHAVLSVLHLLPHTPPDFFTYTATLFLT